MANTNQQRYFVSQSYRQIQLSVNKGTQSYPHSDFLNDFFQLADASSDDYARQLTIELVEETARYNQTTDYLRQEMAFETQASILGDWSKALSVDTTSLTDSTLYERRMNRHTNRAGQSVAERV